MKNDPLLDDLHIKRGESQWQTVRFSAGIPSYYHIISYSYVVKPFILYHSYYIISYSAEDWDDYKKNLSYYIILYPIIHMKYPIHILYNKTIPHPQPMGSSRWTHLSVPFTQQCVT